MKGTVTGQAVRFAPRRLGHANIFVGDLDRSVAFYNRVCGLEEVRREPGIGAGFLTNGNTHHDVGLMQAMTTPRVGRGGHVQVPHGRGSTPGLNHFGWEMESEAVLVAAYRRALEVGVAIHRTADHQLAHSVYLFDPDGNLHEFYADTVEDWRTVFNPEREDLVTGQWEPLAQPATETRYYNEQAQLRSVPGARFPSRRITHAVLVARDFEAMIAFFTDVAGLEQADEIGTETVLLRARASADFDLALFRTRDGLPPGMHHIGFEVADEDRLVAAERNRENDTDIELILDRPDKRSVFVRDPDGIRIEFHAGRAAQRGRIGDAAPALWPYLV